MTERTGGVAEGGTLVSKVETVLACRNRLGEGPIWSAAEQALYWVDILGSTVNRFDPASGGHASWPGIIAGIVLVIAVGVMLPMLITGRPSFVV